MFAHPFSIHGRIKRMEYFISLFIYSIGYMVLLSFITDGDAVQTFIAYVILIPLLWFVIAQGAKRCHDLGKTGWFQIIPFYFLWMLIGPGIAGPNEFDVNDITTTKSTLKPGLPADNSRPDGAPPQPPPSSR